MPRVLRTRIGCGSPQCVPAPGAVTDGAVIKPLEHGREHDAEHGSPGIDERDVHRELAVALEELLRAVERIDEPIARPRAALRDVLRRGFLRQHRHRSIERAQSLADDAVRELIGFRERRAVVLELAL